VKFLLIPGAIYTRKTVHGDVETLTVLGVTADRTGRVRARLQIGCDRTFYFNNTAEHWSTINGFTLLTAPAKALAWATEHVAPALGLTVELAKPASRTRTSSPPDLTVE
jgi:hypothetical protein